MKIANSSKEPRTVTGRLAAKTVFYTGVPFEKCKSEPYSAQLNAGDGTRGRKEGGKEGGKEGRMGGRKEVLYLMTHSTHYINGYMEGRKEMLYLMTHSTHFINGYMEGMKCFI